MTQNQKDNTTPTAIAFLLAAIVLLILAWVYLFCDPCQVWMMSPEQRRQEIEKNEKIIRERDNK